LTRAELVALLNEVLVEVCRKGGDRGREGGKGGFLLNRFCLAAVVALPASHHAQHGLLPASLATYMQKDGAAVQQQQQQEQQSEFEENGREASTPAPMEGREGATTVEVGAPSSSFPPSLPPSLPYTIFHRISGGQIVKSQGRASKVPGTSLPPSLPPCLPP